MSNVRNYYIYIVSAISLNAVTWAVIELLRNLLLWGAEPLGVAFQLAVIIIGMPVYLVHWLWAQRLVRKSDEERGGTLRRLYLYGLMAAFLGPLIPNVIDLQRDVMGKEGGFITAELGMSAGDAVFFHGIAILVLAAVWFYHYRVTKEDARAVPEAGGSATIRRLYVLGFSAAGLAITVTAFIGLLRWIMVEVFQFEEVDIWQRWVLADEVTRLLVGAVIWIVFWLSAQRLFHGPGEEERNSALRKLYLYGLVFLGALDVTANASGILASLIRRIFPTSTSNGDISQPLPIMIGMGVVWAYHAYIIRQDAKLAGETSRQAGIRRVYHYLIAAVGLAALLVGLGGEISVLLRSLETSFGAGLREEFSWYTAAIIAGLPVWLIPWRKAQSLAVSPEAANADERRSVVRKIYLYFFLFVAMMTLLSGAVFILFKILSTLLGEEPLTLTELGHTVAFCLIAVGLLLYHGSILRADSRRSIDDQASQLKEVRLVVMDVGTGMFGQLLMTELGREIPGITLEAIIQTAKAAETGEEVASQEENLVKIANANMIVGPWLVAVPGSAGGDVNDKIAAAVVASSARKLLIPVPAEGWDWAGVERWNAEAITRHTVRAVKQLMNGEQVKMHRPLGVGAIIGILIGALILLSALTAPLLYLFSY